MNKKFKPYFYALLVGTCNALISGITTVLVTYRNGPPFFVMDYQMPLFILTIILIIIPNFMIQFWVISLIIMALVNRLRQKVNPYLIVSVITILITSAPILIFLIFLPSEFWAYFWDDLLTSQEIPFPIHIPIYFLTSIVINLLGFRLLFTKLKTIDTKKTDENEKSGIYFNSLIIGTINGIACSLVIPVGQLLTTPPDLTGTMLASIGYLFFYLIQFWITSLIITFIISRIKWKPLSYIFIFAISLCSALAGSRIMFGSIGYWVNSEGVFYVPMYFIITIVVFLLGYRWLLKKFPLSTQGKLITEIDGSSEILE